MARHFPLSADFLGVPNAICYRVFFDGQLIICNAETIN